MLERRLTCSERKYELLKDHSHKQADMIPQAPPDHSPKQILLHPALPSVKGPRNPPHIGLSRLPSSPVPSHPAPVKDDIILGNTSYFLQLFLSGGVLIIWCSRSIWLLWLGFGETFQVVNISRDLIT